MDKTFNISVRDRHAKNLSHVNYVCGNKGYMVQFDFDEEWNDYPFKTARFVEASGTPHERTVIDNRCEFPQIMDTFRIEVGVFAGDLKVTTPAVVEAERGILSTGGDRPAVPEGNEYDKMMEAINQDAVRAETAADEAEKAAEEAAEKAQQAFDDQVMIVHVDYNASGTLQADREYEEIFDAVRSGKMVFATNGSINYTFFEQIDGNLVFSNVEYTHLVENNGLFARLLIIGKNNSVNVYARNQAKTPNPFKLTITGAVSAEYDGSKAVNAEIPKAGIDEDTLNQAVQDALQEAKDSGEFDGADGADGAPGKDGFSPTVEVDSITGGHRVTITDKDGEKSFDVMDGEDGEGGGTGLPTGGEPHQMLVTDAEGKAKWEERIIRPPEGETVEVLPECKPFVDVDEGSGDIMAGILEPIFTEDVVVGETYTVYWNGIAYKTIAQPLEEDGIVAPVLGDIGLMTGGESTGEPFVIICMSAEMGAEVGYYAMIIPLDGSTDITLKIDRDNIIYHRLPYDYLPEDMYRTEVLPVITNLEETEVAFYQSLPIITKPFNVSLVLGKTYTVMWNGVPYECVAQDAIYNNEHCNALSADGVFYIKQLTTPVDAGDVGTVYAMVTIKDSSTSVKVSIFLKPVIVHQVPEQYLPKSAINNIVSGSGEGSLRNVNAAAETDYYKMGDYALALGAGTLAEGGHSVAIKGGAYGYSSVAIGGNAYGTESVAFRGNAYGYQSVCFGGVARGERSASFGYAFAYGDEQVAFGKNNVTDDESKYAVIVGNGTSDDACSNAHTIDWDGNGWFAGDVYTGGTGQDNGKKLATEEYVQTYIEETLLGGAW